MKDSYIFYASFDEALRELPDRSRLKVYDAVSDYALRGIVAEFNGMEKAIFTLIKAQIDRRNQRVENGKKGGRKKQVSPNDSASEVKPYLNHTLSILEPHLNQSSSEVQPYFLQKEKASPNEKERTKEKDATPKRDKNLQESKKERNLYINNNQGVCACESQETYENIINHYAGDIDEETRAAIWKYIQYFQAKTGCFILNEQLKTFLQNLKNNSLLFEGGVLGCMNSDGINLALMEVGENWGLGRMGQFLRIERDEEYDET